MTHAQRDVGNGDGGGGAKPGKVNTHNGKEAKSELTLELTVTSNSAS